MCETVERGKLVSRNHNGREFEVINPRYREIGVVRVDGCLINDQSKRVDWMIRIPEGKKLSAGVQCAKLVELKGWDVPYAFEQMRATFIHAALDSDRSKVDEGYIVSQLSPSFQTTSQIEIAKFWEDYGIPIHIVPKALIDASP